MPRTRRSTALIFTLALVLCTGQLMVTAPVAAQEVEVTTVDQRTIEGPFWVSWRVRVHGPGSQMEWGIAPSYADAPQISFGMWLVPAEGQHQPQFVLASGGPTSTELVVSDPALGADVEQGGLFGATGESVGVSFGAPDRAVGDYWLVLVNTSPHADVADVHLDLSENVEVLDSAQGATGGLLAETDFESDQPRIHARVGVSTPPLSPNVRHHHLVDGRADLDIQHRLFGYFRARGGDPTDISFVDPDGVETDAGTGKSLTVLPSGEWQFRVNEYRVEPGTEPSVVNDDAYLFLLWADVELQPDPDAEVG